MIWAPAGLSAKFGTLSSFPVYASGRFMAIASNHPQALLQEQLITPHTAAIPGAGWWKCLKHRIFNQ